MIIVFLKEDNSFDNKRMFRYQGGYDSNMIL